MNRSTSSSLIKVHKMVLPPDYKPNNSTVLCGRGKEYYNNVGNRRFRVLVSMHLNRYSAASSKALKSYIVSQVVDAVREAGGGFVRFDKKRNAYIEVGDAVAREKVGAVFRDCLHEQYSSSSKAKAARARQSRLQQPVRDEDVHDRNCSIGTIGQGFGGIRFKTADGIGAYAAISCNVHEQSDSSRRGAAGTRVEPIAIQSYSSIPVASNFGNYSCDENDADDHGYLDDEYCHSDSLSSPMAVKTYGGRLSLILNPQEKLHLQPEDLDFDVRSVFEHM